MVGCGGAVGRTEDGNVIHVRKYTDIGELRLEALEGRVKCNSECRSTVEWIFSTAGELGSEKRTAEGVA